MVRAGEEHSMTSRLGVIAVSAVVIAMASMSWILFLIPDDFHGLLGLGREGADVFGSALFGQPPAPIATEPFKLGLRTALLAAWAAWIIAVSAIHARFQIRPAPLYGASVILVVAVAVAMPPVLSRDAFGYVGYGNLGAAGHNPYIFGNRTAMEAFGDPLARFFVRDTPLAYGPGWALLAMGISVLGASGGLFAQALLHKLVAALALLVAAEGAARLASEATATLRVWTFLAVVLNPLLLVEGPGMGHNDLLMLALMVWAAVLGVRHRWIAGAALMGFACAVKPIAATALPLFFVASWMRERNVPRLGIQGFAAIVPFLTFALLFGGPALVLRAMSGQANPGGGITLFAVAAVVALGAGVWSVFRARTDASAWLPGWIPMAAVLVLFGTQYRFPWYACWLVLPALTGWSEKHRILLTGSSAIAVLLSWLYTI
jgi:hypothetical protein